MTDPKYVYYCLDTAQAAIMGKDILHFYDTYHDRVQYFHIKDLFMYLYFLCLSSAKNGI